MYLALRERHLSSFVLPQQLFIRPRFVREVACKECLSLKTEKYFFEIDSSQSIPWCELNNNLTTSIFSISDSTKADSGNIDHFFLIDSATAFLMGKNLQFMLEKFTVQHSSKFKETPPKHLSRINQYTISKEALQGQKPI